LVIKTLVPELDIDPDPYWPKMLDPDPLQNNANPKHYSKDTSLSLSPALHDRREGDTGTHRAFYQEKAAFSTVFNRDILPKVLNCGTGDPYAMDL
jgi:hypothetical protein